MIQNNKWKTLKPVPNWEVDLNTLSHLVKAAGPIHPPFHCEFKICHGLLWFVMVSTVVKRRLVEMEALTNMQKISTVSWWLRRWLPMVNLSASVGRDRTELSYSCGMCLQKHMVAKGAQNSTEGSVSTWPCGEEVSGAEPCREEPARRCQTGDQHGITP